MFSCEFFRTAFSCKTSGRLLQLHGTCFILNNKHLKIIFFSIFYVSILPIRSSHSDVFCKKGVLRNFAKFTGKHLCQCLFFNKAAGLSSANLLKKRLWHRCFPVNFAKFLRAPFVKEHLRWLLLPIMKAKLTCK